MAAFLGDCFPPPFEAPELEVGAAPRALAAAGAAFPPEAAVFDCRELRRCVLSCKVARSRSRASLLIRKSSADLGGRLRPRFWLRLLRRWYLADALRCDSRARSLSLDPSRPRRVGDRDFRPPPPPPKTPPKSPSLTFGDE